MTRRKLRNPSPQSKVKVAMATIRGDKTLAQLGQQYDVHSNQIQHWKKRLPAEAGALFQTSASQAVSNSEETVAEVHAKIGELAIEQNVFVPSVRTRLDVRAASTVPE